MLPRRARAGSPDESLSFAGLDIGAAVERDFEHQAGFSDTHVRPASGSSRGGQSRIRQSSRSARDHTSDRRGPAVDSERKERGESPPEAQPRGIAKARVDTGYDSADTVSIESQWSPWSPNHTWGLHAFFHRRGHFYRESNDAIKNARLCAFIGMPCVDEERGWRGRD